MGLPIESCSREEACVSLGGSEKLLDELLERLQDWLKLQPHLPQDVPTNTLEYFLLGTKLSLEQAKHKLDMYYTMKRLVPEILTDRDPRGSVACLHTMFQLVFLPKLTPEKYRVCIVRPYVKDYSKNNPFDYVKYGLMLEDTLMTDSRSRGNIYVIDNFSITLGLIAKYTPAVLKKAVVTMTEAYAVRIKGIYFINAVQFTDILFTLVKKVMKPKLAARIHAYPKGDYESLYQHVPRSILPKDYGGEEQSIADLAELWRQKVDEKRDWFLEQDKILVDERLRPGPAFDGDELFGFSGSFRKLDVD